MENKKYEEFNIDQILPILTDLEQAQNVIHNIDTSINEYVEDIHIIIKKLKENNEMSDEVKSYIDKNVYSFINKLEYDLNHINFNKNNKFRKGKLFERLCRGISYIYKMNNGIIIQHPILLKFDELSIDQFHRIVKIGEKNFQFSNYFDLIDTCSNFSGPFDNCLFDTNSFDTNSINGLQSNSELDSCHIENIIKKLHIEKNKTIMFKSYLKILSESIEYSSEYIIDDIKRLKLFDREYLDILTN